LAGVLNSLDRAPLIEPRSRAEWRAWLAANHASSRGVWLVGVRRGGSSSDLDYEASVEEALCFGWIDGQAAALDDQRSKQYFAPRRQGSPWAGTNKARVERLMEAGLMEAAGLKAIERARADGSWTVFDSVERLEVPDDLAAALAVRPTARERWDAFTPSARKQLLSWIALAKRAETRARRVEQTAEAAQRGERANEQRGGS
jgi:uncharacterized protein YdeI (YjbR/CyaY-like superfamily)